MNERKHPRILIVDDNQVLLEAVSEYLRLRHARVTSCESLCRAARILEEEEIDMVLLDVVMPEEGDMRVSTFALACMRKKVPFYLFSGLDVSKLHYWGKAWGARGFLQKPCPFEHIEGLLFACPASEAEGDSLPRVVTPAAA